MILYSHQLYEFLAPALNLFERKNPFREIDITAETAHVPSAEVIVVGLGRYGSRLALNLHQNGFQVLGVEFDPEAARALREKGLAVCYGDCTSSEFLETLPLKQARWIISTLPDLSANRDLLRNLKELPHHLQIAVVARDEDEGSVLAPEGGITLLYPMRNAVEYATEFLTDLLTTKTR